METDFNQYTMRPEMNTLIRLLARKNIPFDVVAHQACGKIVFNIAIPNADSPVIDVASSDTTYGGSSGLLEAMAFEEASEATNYDAIGWLNAYKAMIVIKRALDLAKHK